MKKILCLFLFATLSIVLVSCKANSNNANIIIKTTDETIKKLESTTTIMIGDKSITSKKQIEEIIILISSGIRMQDEESVPYIGPRYILKILDNKDNIIDEIKVYSYWNSENQTSGWITFESNNNGYYLDVDALLEIIDIKN